jgi:hypothetical protein
MRFRHVLPVVAAVSALFAGCSKQRDSEFKEYVDPAPKRPSLPASKPAVATRDAKPAKSSDASSRRNDLARALPAAVGIGSQAVLSDTFRIRAEQWLVPAVGPAAASALLNGIDTAAGPGKRPAPAIGKAGQQKLASGRQVRVLIKNKTFRVEGPDGALRVGYDDINLLKVLNMDPVTPGAEKLMPKWLRDLNGKRIRIRGFMSPTFKQTGLEGFLLGRDNKACCFPGRAKIYDLFHVRMRKGHTANYIQNRPFDVVGTFQIKPWITEDGELLELYRIVDAVVVQ